MPNTTPETAIAFHDGSFKFGIKLPDGTVFEQTVDLILAKITCEECERRHNLQIVDGALEYTSDFLMDLTGSFTRIGLQNITVSVAFQLWHNVSAKIIQLKKNMNEPPNLPTGTESSPEENPPK